MSRLTSTVMAVASIDSPMRGEMYDLFNRYYGGTSEARFLEDLTRKQAVVLLHDDRGRLRGFSLAALWVMDVRSTPVRFVYSGDTIIDDRYWGDLAFLCTWIRMTGAIKALAPDVPLYWCILIMGHRTFKALPTFYRTYYPNRAQDTPPEIQTIIDQLGDRAFGSHYDPGTGVVLPPNPPSYLRQPWVAIPERIRRRPDIQFFIERNPGYAAGDELVFLTELSAGNHKPFTARLFREGMANRDLLPPSCRMPVDLSPRRNPSDNGTVLRTVV